MTPLASSAEVRRGRLPPASHWSPYVPVAFQVLLSLVLGLSLAAVVAILTPHSFSEARIATVTLLHELGHAVVSWLYTGEFPRITLHEDGGSVEISSPNDLGLAVSAGFGVLAPAWTAAAMLAFGLTRIGIEWCLITCGLAILAIAFLHADIPADRLIAISVFASVMVFAGIVPMGGTPRAALCIGIAVALSWAVYETLGYVYMDYIDGDPQRPTDAQIVANALGVGADEEVGHVLIGLMIAAYVAAVLTAWAWLIRIGAIRRFAIKARKS